MKWSKIKDKCVGQAYVQIYNTFTYSDLQLLVVAVLNEGGYKVEAGTTIGRQVKDELWKQIEFKIDNWDVRHYSGLMKLYPKAFPKVVSSVELTDNGWELF